MLQEGPAGATCPAEKNQAARSLRVGLRACFALDLANRQTKEAAQPERLPRRTQHGSRSPQPCAPSLLPQAAVRPAADVDWPGNVAKVGPLTRTRKPVDELVETSKVSLFSIAQPGRLRKERLGR